jgi:FkbM family methyltransferase
MSLIHILKTITSHPLNKNQKIKSIIKFLKWHISSRLTPYSIIYPLTNKSKIIIGRGMQGATGNLYCGLHEFNDMAFLLHFLRPNDLFADIGANVGSYTVLASAHVGANTVCLEPVHSTYQQLQENLVVNAINSKVKALNIAAGAKKGTISFTNNLDTINHVATQGETNVSVLPVDRLDNVLDKIPALIKIDVEGFETEVIMGSEQILSNPNLKAIIIELNGLGKRYGYDENKIHEKLIEFGFNPYWYDPMTRILFLCESFGQENTIYIRDVQFVSDKLKKAEKFKIFDKWI